MNIAGIITARPQSIAATSAALQTTKAFFQTLVVAFPEEQRPLFNNAAYHAIPLLLTLCGLFLRSIPALAAEPSPWLEIHSSHFTVITDAGDKKGREVALRFEQMRAVFATLLGKEHLNQSIPLTILAFITTNPTIRSRPWFIFMDRHKASPLTSPDSSPRRRSGFHRTEPLRRRILARRRPMTSPPCC